VIPPVAHFIWYGNRFPWVNVLALRSACERGDFERVVLHHDADVSSTAHGASLRRMPRLELRRLDPAAIFSRTPVDPEALTRLHDRLEAPNARANMIRAAILAAEGGVYLDTDTITVGSMRPLLDAGAFCGQERVVFPATVMRSRSPWVKARAVGLTTFRDLCRRLPQGWRVFRRGEGAFALAVNNAVLGAAPGHPLIRGLLAAMLEVPEARQTVRYALGTHLLQDRVAAYEGDDLVLHPPEVFYPLGPVVSQHWFRLGGPPPVAEVLSEQTRVVHWYASVRTKHLVPKIDPAYVRAHADRQLFSALAAPYAEPG
jgi:hypothetical protein